MEGRMSETGKLATANRLSDGAVVFLTHAGLWSEEIDSASLALGADAEADLTEAARHAEAVNHVTGSYLIEVERSDGQARPLHIRERIRASGPTVGVFSGPRPNEARHVPL
jgi:hypothetical protein